MPIYTPPRGPLDAKIMIVGEMPGYEDAKARKPFASYSGMELSRMLQEADIPEYECFITYVGRFAPPWGKEDSYISKKKKDAPGRIEYMGRFLKPEMEEHIEHLHAEVKAIQPNVIIALGDLALWALTGDSGITTRRGSVVQSFLGPKVVPTYSPSFILHTWGARPVLVEDLRRALVESGSPDLVEIEYNFIIHPDYPTVIHWCQDMLKKLDKESIHISCDIETRNWQIACIGFGTSPTDAICIPLMCIERKAGYWSPSEEFEVTKLIRAVLMHSNARISGQNFLYDAQYIAKQWGFAGRVWHDTRVAQHVMYPDLPPIIQPQALSFLATMYCEHPRFWKDEGRMWKPGMPEEQYWQYNCKDCVVTWEVAENQQIILKKLELDKAMSFQMELWEPLLNMMLRGMKQDKTARYALKAELATYIASLKSRISTICGRPINPAGSAHDLRKFFYTYLGLKPIYNRGAKSSTTDNKALETIARREPLLKGLTELIQHYRSAGVYSSTFVNMPLSADDRMRTMTNLTRVKTFRLSTGKDAFGSGGNLQNIPRNSFARVVYDLGGEINLEEYAVQENTTPGNILSEAQGSLDDGYLIRQGDTLICAFALPDIRKLFIPDEGYTIIDIDLDRADLQVVVWEAEDVELKQMLREGVDIHSENAKTVGLIRHDAKQFVHATNYGSSARNLAALFRKTVHEMEVAQNRWFSAHPGIKEWHKRTEREMPLCSNKLGFRIQFLERCTSMKERSLLLPKLLAWTPQSTVAIVINQAIINVRKQLPQLELLLQVHDSYLAQCPTELLPTLLPKALDISQITIPYDDPLIIPVSAKVSTKSWGDCKKWKGA